ncbi:MAG: hypothetical protein HDR13_03990 [Lachnospiraceae bacterium]|nr:hypothetical protein [Lachnospiraceae bacterium]
MLIYDNRKYSICVDEEFIARVEKKLNVQCLFGGAHSTMVYEIATPMSDLDFYLIFDRGNTDLREYVFSDCETNFDVNMIEINHINFSNKQYYKTICKYPSIFMRDSQASIPFSNKHRADYTSQLIFEILYSDYIWDSGYLKKNIDTLLSQLSFLGVLDYYYSRVYGHLTNNLSNNFVGARNILMAFLGYSCMKWLLLYQTIPVMKFQVMYELFCPNQFRTFLFYAFQKQIGASFDCDNVVNVDVLHGKGTFSKKVKVMLERNDNFNSWLADELRVIADEMGRLHERNQDNKINIGHAAFCATYLGDIK